MTITETFARVTDPDTSRDAAADVEEFAGPQGRLVLATLVELERFGQDGATAHEVVMRLAYSGEAPQQNVVARRFTTLARMGLVVDSGERRKSGRRGARPLIVWSSTPEGREWLR